MSIRDEKDISNIGAGLHMDLVDLLLFFQSSEPE